MRHILVAITLAFMGCAVAPSDDTQATAWQQVAQQPTAEQAKALTAAHDATVAFAAGDASLRSEKPIDLTGQLVPIGGPFDPETNFCEAGYPDGETLCCTRSSTVTCCCHLYFCTCVVTGGPMLPP